MIVVDTNVLAYLAVPSRYTELAERLLLAESEWAVPVLWRSELRNVLALYLRRSLISFDDAVTIQTELEALLCQGEYEIGSLDVLTLVNQSSCSAYDCEFVALAKALDTKLLTMDRKIVKEFPSTAVLLTDYVD